MNNLGKEIWELFWRLFILLFGFSWKLFSLNLVLGSILLSVRSHFQFDLILRIKHVSQWIEHCIGVRGNWCDLVLVRPCPSTWTGWTHCESWSDIKDAFFIFTCSTLLVDSLTSQFRFWRTRWPSLFLGNQVKLVNLGLLVCGRSVEIWGFVKNYKSNVRENLDRASGLP